jgi:hypothetical protein
LDNEEKIKEQENGVESEDERNITQEMMADENFPEE